MSSAGDSSSKMSGDGVPVVGAEAEQTFYESLVSEMGNFVNILLVALIIVLVFKLFKGRRSEVSDEPPPKPLPKLRKDFTVAELKKYDGTQPDGRVLVAVDGKVFDVTKGKRFYGPGGPYAAFGGRDASRGLATFSVTSSEKEYDDLSDLNSMEMESVREWEMQFTEKYDYVGKLLKPGEEPTSYSDDETESEASIATSKKSD